VLLFVPHDPGLARNCHVKDAGSDDPATRQKMACAIEELLLSRRSNLHPPGVQITSLSPKPSIAICANRRFPAATAGGPAGKAMVNPRALLMLVAAV
jgi:hypothetical protein